MYIEILNDLEGNIKICYVSDSLPQKTGDMFFKMYPLPEKHEQSRIELTTQEAMEIDANTGQRAKIINGEAQIVNVDRSEYIRENYKIDMSVEIVKTINLHPDLKLRKLIKK